MKAEETGKSDKERRRAGVVGRLRHLKSVSGALQQLAKCHSILCPDNNRKRRIASNGFLFYLHIGDQIFSRFSHSQIRNCK